MSFEVYAKNFDSRPWNGTYSAIDTDLWSNGSYYIYRAFIVIPEWTGTNFIQTDIGQSWVISDSRYIFDPFNPTYPLIAGHMIAYKVYVIGSTPVGNYTGIYGFPNGIVSNTP